MTGDPGQRSSWQGLGYLRKEAEAEAGTKSQRLFLSPLPSLSSQQHVLTFQGSVVTRGEPKCQTGGKNFVVSHGWRWPAAC